MEVIKVSNGRWVGKDVIAFCTYVWNMCDIPYNAEKYYFAIKRDEIESFVNMWMNLESVTQSEVRKTNIKY